MALAPLGKMTAAEYSELAKEPRNLMRYNSELPQPDYEHPYQHQEYPKHLFRVERTGNKQRLRTAEIADAVQDKEYKAAGWVENPALCDPPVETMPAAPHVRITDTFELELPDAAEQQIEPVRRGKNAAAGA